MIGKALMVAQCIVSIMKRMDIDAMESVVEEMEALLHSLRHYCVK